jgi:hypothetical protein
MSIEAVRQFNQIAEDRQICLFETKSVKEKSP